MFTILIATAVIVVVGRYISKGKYTRHFMNENLRNLLKIRPPIVGTSATYLYCCLEVVLFLVQ